MNGPKGALQLVGRLVDASNATFLAMDADEAHWVYKPVAGESPLWDFPTATLGRREVAAYALSQELGFGVVPLTVWCEGPLGEGSAQRWIDGEPTPLIDLLDPSRVDEGWLPILTGLSGDDKPVVLAHRDDPQLRSLALFDALLNNSDRKASHVLAHGDVLAGVDHGVSLHAEDKLRTVLWGWAGDPLSDDEVAVVSRAAAIDAPLAPGLDDDEWAALRDRAEAILAAGTMPRPSERWPSIPWPPI
ncbi:SCO1664 family protein [Tessaracoccus lubricantis]|uniref:SCO1664 family protein n=1 Tax=Tessaracoccus lubricantis TaxID=545543 RepID=A0ABP9F3B1_9ACTN